jgi:hypothetical protein
MSDREFENYLTLLAGLLRLSGKQRDAIAAELRSHLEDRLDELVASGVSREEAVKQALAEFGDAAGLAGQFVAISSSRKRRWLVRLMTFSVAATLLITASLIIFWPGRNAAPGRAVAVAQAPTGADPFAPGGDAAAGGGPAEPSEPTLQQKLNKRIDINVVEVPIKDVMQFLQDTTGIQFVLKQKKLEEAGVSADSPVTRSLKRVRVSTLLDLILSDFELAYVEKDDLLEITTPEDAESRLEIRVYDCRDLLAMEAAPGADKFLPRAAGRPVGGMFAVEDRIAQRTPRPGAAGGMGGGVSAPQEKDDDRPVSEHDVRAERLMQIIITNVDMDSWRDIGGPGTISEYNGLIVVTQTNWVHRKVEHVFDMLREAAGLEAAKGTKVVR